MIEKPPYGQPCNKCGQCCEDMPCPLGSLIFQQSEGACPALQTNKDGTRTCGLVSEPEQYAPFRTFIVGKEQMQKSASFLIGADSGCDALRADEVMDSAFRYQLHQNAQKRKQHALAAAVDWGVGKK
jgi:hypothetical protein